MFPPLKSFKVEGDEIILKNGGELKFIYNGKENLGDIIEINSFGVSIKSQCQSVLGQCVFLEDLLTQLNKESVILMVEQRDEKELGIPFGTSCLNRWRFELEFNINNFNRQYIANVYVNADPHLQKYMLDKEKKSRGKFVYNENVIGFLF